MHLFSAHRALIIAAIAVGIAFAWYSASRYAESGRWSLLLFVAAGTGAAVAFVAYLRWFQRKTRRIRGRAR
jgi:F0F1-type ATP synthase assembly protein I